VPRNKPPVWSRRNTETSARVVVPVFKFISRGCGFLFILSSLLLMESPLDLSPFANRHNHHFTA
jgi:hypothetical protein